MNKYERSANGPQATDQRSKPAKNKATVAGSSTVKSLAAMPVT